VKNRRINLGLHPNWNVGIMEYWNHAFWDDGMVGPENLSEIGCAFLPVYIV
jgi:hypothetical protein